MAWILLVFTHFAHASYEQDYQKIRICEELRVNLRELSVESCFRGKFKITKRGDVIDFRWRYGKNLLCLGSIYEGSGVHIDGCYR